MKKYFLISFILIHVHSLSFSQSQEKAYALLIMNFAKNIQWPSHSIGNRFTIGVLGYPPLMSEIQTSTQSKSIIGKPIEVKEIYSADDAKGCAIIFIPSFKSKKIPEIVELLGAAPTLIVTNAFNHNEGTGINLLLKDGKLTYEIKSKSIEAKGLKIPSSIKNMGIVID